MSTDDRVRTHAERAYAVQSDPLDRRTDTAEHHAAATKAMADARDEAARRGWDPRHCAVTVSILDADDVDLLASNAYIIRVDVVRDAARPPRDPE
jgi:hypothetical protein